MSSTVNVDIAVNQSQLQAALSNIQQTISTSSVGSVGSLGGGFGRGGTAPMGGGGIARVPFSIPAHPNQHHVAAHAIPFEAMRRQSEGMMNQAMGQAVGMGGSMMPGMNQMFNPVSGISNANKWTVAGIKSGAASLVSLGGWKAGAAIGTMIMPGAGSVVGGMIGGFAGSMMATKIAKATGLTGWTDKMAKRIGFGSDYNDPLSSANFKSVLGRMENTKRGAFYAASTGWNKTDFVTERARSGFMNQQGINMNKRAMRLSADPGDYARASLAYTYTEQGRKDTLDIASFEKGMMDSSTGKITLANQKILDSSTQRVRSTKAIAGYLRDSATTGMSVAQLASAQDGVMSYRAPTKRVSGWTRMGHAMGKQLGYGKKWGKDMVYAAKGLANTNLDMTKDERKTVGSAKKRAAMLINDVMGGVEMGGLNWTQLALLDRGKTPGSIWEVSGQAASALGDVGSQIRFMGRYDKIIKTQGPRAMMALGRKTFAGQIAATRQMYGLDEKTTNTDIGIMMHRGQGYNQNQARAMTNMKLGIGKKSIVTGGSGGLVSLKTQDMNEANLVLESIKKAKLSRGGADDMKNMSNSEIMQTAQFSKGFARQWANKNRYVSAAINMRRHDVTSADAGAKIQKRFGLSDDMTSVVIARAFSSPEEAKSTIMNAIKKNMIMSDQALGGTNAATKYAAWAKKIGGGSQAKGLALMRTILKGGKAGEDARNNMEATLGRKVADSFDKAWSSGLKEQTAIVKGKNLKFSESKSDMDMLETGETGKLITLMKQQVTVLEIMMKKAKSVGI